MELLKIICLCIIASVFYGIVHDQVTARVCIEYFTVFHPPVFATNSPTLLGIGWGIIATWWVGAVMGLMVGLTARLGSRPLATAREVAPLVGRLLLVMAVCAVALGLGGYFWGTLPVGFVGAMPSSMERRFLFDWYAHLGSYGTGILGGLVVCVIVWRRRIRERTTLAVD